MPIGLPGLGRSSTLLLIAALPLVVFVVGLAVFQFDRQRAAMLADLTAQSAEQHYAVSTMLAGADRELTRMRVIMEEAIADPPAELRATVAARLFPVTARRGDATIAGLQSAGAEAVETAGNLLALPDIAQAGPSTLATAAATLKLLDALALERRLGSQSHWSYFFSADGAFIGILPGAPLKAFVDALAPDRKVATMGDLIAYWLSYAVFRSGTPEENPSRGAYWTPVYEDAGGGGPMVSYAAPVDAGGRFAGIVATDILLARFQDVLDHMSQPLGMMAILDGQGEILAVDGVAFDGDRERMRARLAGADKAGLAAAGGSFAALGDDWVLAQPLPHSPFRLVYLVPGPDLTAHLLPAFAGYGAVLVGLVATLGAILALLHIHFIGPSGRLAAYVAARAQGGAAEPPPMPRAWQAPVEAIGGAFEMSRVYRERLEESEARFLAAMSSLTDGFAILSPEGTLIYANAAFETLVGDGMVEAFAATPDGGGFEHRGRFLAVRRNAMAGGGAVVLVSDVTEARRAELDLRKSEERYRNVVNTQTELVARYTPDGVPNFVNDAYCRYMNMTKEQLLAGRMSDFDYIVDEDRPRHDAHIASLSPSQPTKTITFRSRLPDGTLHWEEWTDTGIFDASGRLVEMQSVGREITETMRAEEALRAAEALMGAFMQHAPVAILSKDREGRFTMVNPEAARRLGRPVADILGRNTSDVIPASEAEVMDRSNRVVVATGEVQVEEQYHPSLDPFLHSLFIRFPLRAPGGEITGVGIFVVDQTGAKAAEVELDRQREALHQNEKLAALGSLLAGVAHELNNPLSIVVGYAGMLHDMAKDEPTRRRTNEIRVAAERCARIVRTFLAMARSKPVEKQRVDIDRVLDEAVELAAYGLRSNGVVVERRLGGAPLPPVFADADQLHQVFMNVVLNAQQAMMDVAGPRRLTLSTRREGADIVVDIEDTGPGIDETVRQRAFEPFFTTKPQGVGTGIGLSVSLGIVKAHEGSMQLECRRGGGTRCRVTIPVAAEDSLAETVGPPDLRGLSGRLLVVDDEQAITRLLAETFRADGLDVVVANGGREACRLIEAEQFDAVITDLRMPDVAGAAVAAFAIKTQPALCGRVIVMTGDALGAGRTLDGHQLVEKPIDIGVLRQMLRRILPAATTDLRRGPVKEAG
ncbi:PAS domain S-box protein [Ensifer soli]|uniref:PAS domain S-box protein n=1 Tax=Ciceribacter sp. sgz301302 TaxID=3342379 RepID=UPI0035BB75EB